MASWWEGDISTGIVSKRYGVRRNPVQPPISGLLDSGARIEALSEYAVNRPEGVRACPGSSRARNEDHVLTSRRRTTSLETASVPDAQC
jgi:hypothetical protein